MRKGDAAPIRRWTFLAGAGLLSALLAFWMLKPERVSAITQVPPVKESPEGGAAAPVIVDPAPPAEKDRDAQAAELPVPPKGSALATFAGGSIWCMEPPFENLVGVYSVIAGFSGGEEANPTYVEVSRGRTGHAEAVQVTYDPSRISYATLLEVFWRQVDPTDKDGQFADRGRQFRPALFYHNDEQKRLAEASRDVLARSGRFRDSIAVEIAPFRSFYPAEEYHQDYYRKDPGKYERYRKRSGREAFLEKTWGGEREAAAIPVNPGNDGVTATAYRKPPDSELRRRLTPLQYEVVRNGATEPAYGGEYWANHADGIYVDIVSGEPLFSSKDKFESGTGWPSFTQPLEKDNVVEVKDRSHGMVRTEVRSRYGKSHLGHVFKDGPAPTGLRYCLNSAALRFVPADSLAKQGYAEYAPLFEKRAGRE